MKVFVGVEKFGCMRRRELYNNNKPILCADTGFCLEGKKCTVYYKTKSVKIFKLWATNGTNLSIIYP